MISTDLCSSAHFQYVEFNVPFGRKKLNIKGVLYGEHLKEVCSAHKRKHVCLSISM